jgi:hypothetical protein
MGRLSLENSVDNDKKAFYSLSTYFVGRDTVNSTYLWTVINDPEAKELVGLTLPDFYDGSVLLWIKRHFGPKAIGCKCTFGISNDIVVLIDGLVYSDGTALDKGLLKDKESYAIVYGKYY